MGNKAAVMAEYDNKSNLYGNFASEVEHLIKNILKAERIVCNAITFRLKKRESLSDKIDKKNDKYTALEEVTDIAGVRVITYYAEDVDKVAEIVEREFVVDRGNSIDKRDALEPDRFGYCSVHYVVEMSRERLNLPEYQAYKGLKCEIQIRSVLQHAWAEIEHDLGYKNEISIPKEIRRNFSQLAGLLEIADKEFQEIRSLLQTYQDEASKKVASEEFQDKEIDAILLEAIIESNPDIKELNQRILEYFGIPFSRIISTWSLEDTISRLRWFGVNTVNQLNSLIENNKAIAETIAKENSYNDSTKNDTDVAPFSKTIALFYICYAELLRGNPDYDKIAQYLDATNISRYDNGEDNVLYFLRLSKKINTPS